MACAHNAAGMERLVPQLTPDLLQKMHAYWRAANYLTVGQI